MNSAGKLNSRGAWLVFGAALLLALNWVLSTQHVWEDYYITFRSSKNLATGHGLVFNPGERLHTFTSPLGVLLPAAASRLTGNHSDLAAIWLFRVWSGAAFAGAAVLAWAVARRFRYGAFAATALAAGVMLDGKSLDFSTNGMETGFLLLFLAYSLWAMFACAGRRGLHLGLAWGGLMWTRPDSFLYVGLPAVGVVLFNDPARTGLTRGQWLKLFLQAGAVCTALYLPWLEWAWWYYGTPVPHTITAKGGVITEPRTVWGILKTLVDFPVTVWTGKTSLEGTFLPSYYQIGGWPAGVVTAARTAAVVLAFQWALPWWRVEVRAASFAYCGLHVYLSYFPFFPFPWYLPGTSFLAAVTLGGMLAQVLAVAHRRAVSAGAGIWSRWFEAAVLTAALFGLGAEGWLTWQMRREMALEQVYSATGTRRAAGEWLKAHAQPGDTVFMEPLGHIAYFSGLRTYDFPGLSSREMVHAIRELGTDWAYLIDYLSPDWLVLRPPEVERVKGSMPFLLGAGNTYQLVHELDNVPQIQRYSVLGRNYVEFDAHLLIFRRTLPRRFNLDTAVTFPFEHLGLPEVTVRGQQLYVLHANEAMSLRVPANAKRLWITYGIPGETEPGNQVSENVEFIIQWTDGRHSERLLSRRLRPQANPVDRGVQVFEAKLPRHDDGAEIIVMTRASPTDHRVRVCWGDPDFVR